MFINKQIYIDLSILYNQSHRHYHNINHINHCLGELQQYKEKNKLLLKREVEYAIWFHDAVYNPFSKTNEEDSANLFLQYVRDFDLSIDENLVCKMISATKNHEIINNNGFTVPEELNVFLDIDMSILGQSQEVYLDYADKIRKEYAHVPYQTFSAHRLSFLDKLRNNKDGRIFKTDYFRNLYEKKARYNIAMEIKHLNK